MSNDFLKESDEGINKFLNKSFNDINKSEFNFDLDAKNNSTENFEEKEIWKLPLKERLIKWIKIKRKW